MHRRGWAGLMESGRPQEVQWGLSLPRDRARAQEPHAVNHTPEHPREGVKEKASQSLSPAAPYQTEGVVQTHAALIQAPALPIIGCVTLVAFLTPLCLSFPTCKTK